MNEVQTLSKLNHPNVVQYLGIHEASNGEKYIVMEYLSHGSLSNLLLKESRNMTVRDLIDMAKQAAAGMLHLENANVVHRDLALRNILVGIGTNGSYVVKISDFGLSRSVESSYYKSNDDQVPVKWCAPEVLDYGIHTRKSDVYSFGILLWELFSYGVPPFNNITNNEARLKILHGDHLPCPRDCPKIIYNNVILKCWNKVTQDRPTFQTIFEDISNFWMKNKDVPELNVKKNQNSPIPNGDHEGLYANLKRAELSSRSLAPARPSRPSSAIVPTKDPSKTTIYN